MLKKINDFINETKSEVSKVTWPKKKETMMTSASVLFMVFLAALFFLFVDWFFSTVIKFIF
jgi:preprotein translocase subunit SecE